MISASARRVCAALGALSVVASGAFALGRAKAPSAPPYDWQLPPGFPTPVVPEDNPMTDAKVALGRHLFYDTRLSGTGTFSCASCHEQQRAFADALPLGVGSTGEVHPRGSMSLGNVAYSPALTWANPLMKRLEQQALVPMFGEDPVELGLAGKEKQLLERLRAEPLYTRLFRAAYPTDTAITLQQVVQAIASFERTLITGRSPYDAFKRGNPSAISASAKRGEALFFGEQTECFHCHGGFNFTGTVNYVDKGFVEVEFHNTALYNIDGKGGYPAPNTGIHDVTNNPDDMGKFKAPSLRNIAVTAPYMHDGSIATLEQVIEHYDAGGRTIRTGPHAGVGADSPLKSEFIKPMGLTAQDKRDLVAFLRSLTDSTFLHDPRFTNPWSNK
jgi:cytochrome c peroxidase